MSFPATNEEDNWATETMSVADKCRSTVRKLEFPEVESNKPISFTHSLLLRKLS